MPVAMALRDDLVVGGHLVAPRGSVVAGHVAEVKPPRSFGRAAEVKVAFEALLPLGPERVPVFLGEKAKEAASTDKEVLAAAGAAVRRELDAVTEPVALLVVADGAITLTERAPGALDLRAPEVQAELDEALRSGRRDLLAALDPSLCRELGIGGRAPWQAMAGAFTDDPTQTTSDYCGAPYGVGYHVGTWLP